MRIALVTLGLALCAAGCGKSEAKERRRHRRPEPAQTSAGPDGGAPVAAEADGGAAEAHEGAEHRAHPAPAPGGPSPAVATMGAAAMLGEIVQHNALFVHDHGPGYFADFRDAQHPRATLVGCADSRFHVGVLDGTADGDVFEIRNIGNQVDATPGSVEYGVRHLHTPLLLIVGHVGCGAVKAAMDGTAELEPPVRTEVARVAESIGHGGAPARGEDAWLENVQRNVHRQVAIAVEHFAPEVEAGTLWVVGAVYDFRDDLGRGQGRFVILDVNGSGAPAESPLLQLVLSTEGADDAVAIAPDAPAHAD